MIYQSEDDSLRDIDVEAFIRRLSNRGRDELLTMDDKSTVLALMSNRGEGVLRKALVWIEHEREDVLLGLTEALNELGLYSDAEAILRGHMSARPTVHCALGRTKLLDGDFEGAISVANAGLKFFPGCIQLMLCRIAALYELQDVENARLAVAQARLDATETATDLDLFDYAVERAAGEPLAISRLDSLYSRNGCSPVRVVNGGTGLFDEFECQEAVPVAPCTARRGAPPLISVIMTAYNAADYIDTAVRSVLAQSYPELELIIVDDCSSDGTGERLLDWQRTDARVRVLTSARNNGTYVCKNTALQLAVGEFVAFQDADDWSHADRLARSVEALQGHPESVAAKTDWVRMEQSGGLIVLSDGRVAHDACISLVFRREPVLHRLGFFDSVRIEADAEFMRRIEIAFGPKAIVHVPVPLLFGRMRGDSLTYNPYVGLGSADRERYRAAQTEWHERLRAGADLFIPFPQLERPFAVPSSLLPAADPLPTTAQPSGGPQTEVCGVQDR